MFFASRCYIGINGAALAAFALLMYSVGYVGGVFSLQNPNKKQAFSKRSPVYRLTLVASMTALSVVLCRFLGFAPMDSSIRFEIGFLPIAILGEALGPLYSGAAYLLADILGSFVQGYPPNLWISGCKLLFGILLGVFFYKRRATLLRAVLVFTLIAVFIDIVAMTPIFIYMYGQPPAAAYAIRAVNAAANLPLRIVSYYYLSKALRGRLS